MDVVHGDFIWNSHKEKANVLKHGVDFSTAVRVFSDPQRQIFEDESHSSLEKRYYCIARVDGRILTLRFVYRDKRIRIIGAGYWRKGRKYYEEKED